MILDAVPEPVSGILVEFRMVKVFLRRGFYRIGRDRRWTGGRG